MPRQHKHREYVVSKCASVFRAIADTVAASGHGFWRQPATTCTSPSSLLTNRSTRYAPFDISKLESGAIKAEPSDLTVAALFRELRSDFEGIAANEGLRLQIEECMDCVYSDLRWWSRF